MGNSSEADVVDKHLWLHTSFQWTPPTLQVFGMNAVPVSQSSFWDPNLVTEDLTCGTCRQQVEMSPLRYKTMSAIGNSINPQRDAQAHQIFVDSEPPRLDQNRVIARVT